MTRTIRRVDMAPGRIMVVVLTATVTAVVIAMTITTTSANVIDFRPSAIGWSVSGAGSSVSSPNVRISLPISSHISPHRVGLRLPRIGVPQGFHPVSRSALKRSVVAGARTYGCRVVWAV